MIPSDRSIESFRTDLGWMALAWGSAGLTGIVFGYKSESAARQAMARSTPDDVSTPDDASPSQYAHDDMAKIAAAPMTGGELSATAERLIAFAAGQVDDLLDIPVDLGDIAGFYRQALIGCRQIGYGETITYGELAKAVGSPKAARAVGHAMSKNRWPLVIPCHRVVAAAGKLGGFSNPQGLSIKERLLTLEQRGIAATRGKIAEPARPFVQQSLLEV